MGDLVDERVSLGSCRVCGSHASVVYPLLPGSPAFCDSHHNPKDAGPFGCDFAGPDDFDIPWGDEEVYVDPYMGLACYTKKQFKKWHKEFVWTDKSGVDHKIRDIDDTYLSNIIGFLRRTVSGGTYFNGGVVRFLEDELESRKGEW